MINYNKVIPVKFYLLYYWIERSIAWFLFNILFRIKIEGKENIDHSQPFIILSNHLSYLDPPLVGIVIPKPIAYMSKSELFKIPLLNIIMRWSGAYSVTRGSKDSSYIDNTIYALKNNWLVTIFPEGKRSRDGKFCPVKPGAAKILAKHPVPFLPIILVNTDKAWAADKYRLNFFTKIHVKIGKTVYPDQYLPKEKLSEEELINHITKIYESKLLELLPEKYLPNNN